MFSAPYLGFTYAGQEEDIETLIGSFLIVSFVSVTALLIVAIAWRKKHKHSPNKGTPPILVWLLVTILLVICALGFVYIVDATA